MTEKPSSCSCWLYRSCGNHLTSSLRRRHLLRYPEDPVKQTRKLLYWQAASNLIISLWHHWMLIQISSIFLEFWAENCTSWASCQPYWNSHWLQCSIFGGCVAGPYFLSISIHLGFVAFNWCAYEGVFWRSKKALIKFAQ